MNPSSAEISRKTILRLLLISFLIEAALLCYNIFEEYKYDPQSFAQTHIADMSGDAHSYFEPIESFLQNGTYRAETEAAGFSYYGRTPHYGVFYGFFRLFLSQSNALDSVIVLQLLIRLLACVSFYRLSLLLTKNQKVAWIAFGIFTCLAPASLYLYRFMTESIALSFFIFSLTLLFRWKISKNVHA